MPNEITRPRHRSLPGNDAEDLRIIASANQCVRRAQFVEIVSYVVLLNLCPIWGMGGLVVGVLLLCGVCLPFLKPALAACDSGESAVVRYVRRSFERLYPSVEGATANIEQGSEVVQHVHVDMLRSEEAIQNELRELFCVHLPAAAVILHSPLAGIQLTEVECWYAGIRRLHFRCRAP